MNNAPWCIWTNNEPPINAASVRISDFSGLDDNSRIVGNPDSAGINRHEGVSKEGWRIQ
jgi:hypothetical protein